jgi:hypothetical protein
LRWEERSAQAPFGTIKREEWDAILAKQAARKAEEEAEEAEFEMRRIQEKKAERAQFALAETVTDDENSPASGWAGHQLKVIVKVVASHVLLMSSDVLIYIGGELCSSTRTRIYGLVAP